jgi:uncharacterized membrane protein YphA (DoxX/SURF4 family)
MTEVSTARRQWLATFVRVAVAAGFLSAVADRFGLWGPPDGAGVAWGDFAHFTRYAGRLNPWAPATLVPVVAWTATVAEIAIGVALLLGWQVRRAGILGGFLLLAFALGMIFDEGVKGPLDASVFAAAAAAFALAVLGPGKLALDRDR